MSALDFAYSHAASATGGLVLVLSAMHSETSGCKAQTTDSPTQHATAGHLDS